MLDIPRLLYRLQRIFRCVETAKRSGAGATERCLEVLRQRRRHVDLVAGQRVRERKPRRVEELAAQLEVAPHAVGRVARDGELDRSEVYPDLVRPAGLEADAEQRVLGQQLLHLEVR